MKYITKNSVWTLCVPILIIFTLLSCSDISEKTYTLTILSTGNGTVYPSGTMEVIGNEPLNISAVPENGYSFSGWEVVEGKGVKFGNRDEAETMVTLTEGDASIRVNFSPTQCFLTLSAYGQGTTIPEPDIPVSIQYNEPVHIEAVAFEDWVFVNWEATAGICNFTNTYAAETTVCILSEQAVIRANFARGNYTLTVTHEGNGTTDPAGEIPAAHGIPIRINAVPDNGWVFHSWEIISGTGCSFGNIYSAETTIALTSGDAVIRANFRDAQAPGAYTVVITQAFIDENNETSLSFTYTSAEAEGTYHYSIDDQANTSTLPVSGSGLIGQETETVTGIDVSSLEDGTLILFFYITDPSGNDGDNVYDTVFKDTVAPVFISIVHQGSDDIYRSGETITFIVTMGEPGLLVTADLSVLDSSYSSGQIVTNTNGNYYSFTTAPLNSGTMIEGTDIPVEFTASDTVHTVTDNSLAVTLDNTPPDGSFIIESADDAANGFTFSLSVTLDVNISGAAQMRFSNTMPGLSTASWEAYAESKAWTLPAVLGVSTVYGEFRDTAGNTFLWNDDIFFIKTLKASDGAGGDNFGRSVSVSSNGTIVAVGADGDNSSQGAVYIFSQTVWGTETKLAYNDGAAGDLFGNSVSVSPNGSIIAVGAVGDDSVQGSAFMGYGTNWGSAARKILAPRVAGDSLGCSISSSYNGNIVAAGAYGVNSGAGAVYVYSGGPNFWPNTVIPLTAGGSAQFGSSVAISSDGSTIVAGSPGNNTNTGAVYVCYGTDWGTQVVLTADDGVSGDLFGHSVAVSSDGSTIVVGAYNDDSFKGAIYVYDGVNWEDETKLTASDGEAGDYFGISVSLSSDGSIIAVGASHDDDKGTYAGAAYVYSGTNWEAVLKHTAADGAMLDYFGTSVAISGDGSTIVIGATGDDDNGNNSGSVYVLPTLISID